MVKIVLNQSQIGLLKHWSLLAAFVTFACHPNVKIEYTFLPFFL